MRKISLINQLELQKRKREREKKETTYEQLNLPHFSGLVMFSSTEGIEGTMIQKGNKAAAAGASNRSISRCENSTRAKDNIYQNGPEDLPPGGFLIRIEFLVRPLASSSTSATLAGEPDWLASLMEGGGGLRKGEKTNSRPRNCFFFVFF